MNNIVARQWEILRIVPKHPNSISSREISDRLNLRGFEVSKRTIERDLRELSQIFPLVANETAQPYAWYWIKDISGEFGGVALDEAISLSLAGELLKTTLPDAMLNTFKDKFNLSKQKLSNLRDLSVSKLRDKFAYVAQSLPFEKVKVSKIVIESIENALIKNKQLSIKYEPKDKERHEYIVNPLGLVQAGVRPYLIATKEGGENIIAFAMQRIRYIACLESKVQVPKGFSLEEYIASDAMQFGLCETIKFKAYISESLATYLTESAISPDQKISYVDGKWKLSATLKDSWSLYMWVRSQGSEITVISPKRIQTKVYESLKESMQNYKFLEE